MERVDSKFCEGCAGALTAKNIELDDMRAALASKEAEIQALAERCAGMQKDRENLKLEIIALRVGEIVCRKCTGHARGSFFHCPWCGERRTPEEMRGEDGSPSQSHGEWRWPKSDAAMESERDAGSDNGVEIGPRVEAKP